MMPKSLLITTMLLASLTVSSHAFGYALIDLDPGSAAPTLTVAQEPADEEVEAVTVSSKQRGHLLALVPVSFWVKVVAWADGRLEVEYPWYSFMTLTSRQELQTQLKVAVNNARSSAALGSVRGAGEADDPKFTAAEAKAVREGIEKVLSGEANE